MSLTSKATSRIIVRTDLIYERDGYPSKFWGEPYYHPVVSAEAAYEREVMVGQEDWKELDLGFSQAPSLLYLKNLPTKFQVNPTPEEQTEADAKVIEFDGMPIIIRPGRDTHFEFTDKDKVPLRVRCRSGSTRLLVVAVPQ